jgi:putative resolvase
MQMVLIPSWCEVEYATRNGIKYRAAWNRYKAGRIEGAYLDDSGHVVVPDPRHAERISGCR